MNDKGTRELVAPEKRTQSHTQLLLMRPAVFIGCWILLGAAFALQEWFNLHKWGYKIGLGIELKSWCCEFATWGIFSWLVWRLFGSFIRTATLGSLLVRILPLSLALCLAEEIIFVLLFPNIPLNRPHMPFWSRLQFQLNAETVDNLVIFWCSIFLFRGLGYYQRSRESEAIASQLEVQLANARLAALRMQLNPHFLFNAMNSISSLMRTDVNAADEMLEQLSSLLRITLERGPVQLIALRDELDFIEVYLSMQDRRYADRVKRCVFIDPELYDALVPSMFLQPIIENAYVHGLSKIDRDGSLVVEARKVGQNAVFTVTNNGVGLLNGFNPTGHGVGIKNLQSRLQLHYAGNSAFEITEVSRTQVRVRVTLPFQLSKVPEAAVARFGTE